jgi:O-phospho-L-seryl-tRNASec:L-selenocysteinyl-tRNA synthase
VADVPILYHDSRSIHVCNGYATTPTKHACIAKKQKPSAMSAVPPSSSSSPALLNDEYLSYYIPKTHASVGLANVSYEEKEIRILLTHRRLPDHGWTDFQIEGLLHRLATLDTNRKGGIIGTENDDDKRWCGVGEREGRVYNSMVRRRHYGLAHGMGRSGDLREPQPKAAGSSVLVQLTTSLCLDTLRRACGLHHVASHGLIAPLCTGMSVALVLSALLMIQNKEKEEKKEKDNDNATQQPPRNRRNNRRRNVVLWSRIDQKSCFKAILAAGCHVIVVPTKLDGDAVITDLDALRELIELHHHQQEDHIVAIVSTTSCFAPRLPDRVDEIARLCQTYNIPHVINHAYGLQCSTTCKLLERANTIGRVDAIICSTDKNFLVPVGGAIIFGPQADIIEQIGQVYAGRASISPILDIFITLLGMGMNGYKRLLDDRKRLIDEYFVARFRQVAEKYGERLLEGCISHNTISYGMTLDKLCRHNNVAADEEQEEEDGAAAAHKETSSSNDVTKLGAMLFTRCVSGTRVVARHVVKTMDDNIQLVGFGSSYHAYPHHYMTAAAAIGLTQPEAAEFFQRLDKTLAEWYKQQEKQKKKNQKKQLQPEQTEQPADQQEPERTEEPAKQQPVEQQEPETRAEQPVEPAEQQHQPT